MTIQVTVRDNSVTDGMKRYATEKGEKLSRFFNGIHKCEVILGADGQQRKAEIVLSITGAAPIVSHAEHEQLNAAIDLATDRAEKQLLKFKEKLRNHHRDGAAAPEFSADDPDENLETYDDIIEKRDFPS